MKTIIKIILTILLSFISSYTYAQTGDKDITISTLEKKINLNDTFNLNISVNLGDSNEIGEKTIVGIDKFYKLGESNSYRFESINGVSRGIYELTIKLKPREKGKFNLGPVNMKLGDKTLISNTIEIEVDGSNNLGNNSVNEDKELTIEDIHDIERPKNTFNFGFGFIIVFLIILFFIGFFYLFRYYNYLKKQEIQTMVNNENKEILKNKYFFDKLKDLEKKRDSYDRSIFFSMLNILLREFLESEGLYGARNMTFKELEKNKSKIDSDLFEIIKDTYFKEFRKEDSELDRKKILKVFKNKLYL